MRPHQRKKTADIRGRVMDRGDGCCESCGMGTLQLEMDHFFGGSLKRSMERFETCWALCRLCHHRKTNNSPDRVHWLDLFIDHCKHHGYETEIEIARGKLEAFRIKTWANHDP